MSGGWNQDASPTGFMDIPREFMEKK